MLSDLRAVVRSLSRSPGYTFSVVVILALGIGASAAIFSVVASVLFPAMSYPDPASLVRIESLVRNSPYPWSPPLVRFRGYRESAASFRAIEGLSFDTANLHLADGPMAVSVARVTSGWFSLLGTKPAVGRLLGPADAEPGANDVAVLGYNAWRSRFALDPNILDRELRIGERIYRVVGVLDRQYHAPNGSVSEVYLPWTPPSGPLDQEQAGLQVLAVGRLQSGTTITDAQAELRTIRPEKGTPYERWFEGAEAVLAAIDAPQPHPVMQRYRAMYQTAFAAVLFLYAIAGFNAANLMLLRAVGRRRELGIRLALGGTSWDVARPFLLEGVVLAVGASVGGLLVAKWLFPALLALTPGDNAWLGERFHLEWRAVVGLASLALVTGLAIAAVPAWQAARRNLNRDLKEGGSAVGESRRLRAVRSGFVVLEAALAVALLVGTGAMVRAYHRLQQTSPGYDPAHKYLVTLSHSREDAIDPKLMRERHTQLLERLTTIRGVVNAAVANPIVPMFRATRPVKLATQPESPEVQAMGVPTSAQYFAALGVPLRLGRDFRDERPGGSGVVVINESMARQYFSDQNPLGQILEVPGKQRWEIIGVVGDIRTLRDAPAPTYYFPSWQRSGSYAQLLLRLNGPPDDAFPNQVRRVIFEVEPRFTVTAVRSLEKQLANEIAQERLTLAVLQVLSAVALILAVSGLFATMAYTVAQRRREFGVRSALGATPASLRRLVVRQGVLLTAVGVIGGVAASWGLSRFMAALLPGGSSFDPLIFAMVGALMLLVATMACLFPARRAARVDVMELLRTE